MIDQKTKNVYCPICGGHFTASAYLNEVFAEDSRMMWISNMVTHYRHRHITSWNKCWGRNGHYYRKHWFTDYEEEKNLVNERAKRQIMRKCKTFMLQNQISPECIAKLQGTTAETMTLAYKLLSTKNNESNGH